MSSREILIALVATLGIIAFYTWALEIHRTLREVLVELRRIRDQLDDRDRLEDRDPFRDRERRTRD